MRASHAGRPLRPNRTTDVSGECRTAPGFGPGRVPLPAHLRRLLPRTCFGSCSGVGSAEWARSSRSTTGRCRASCTAADPCCASAELGSGPAPTHLLRQAAREQGGIAHLLRQDARARGRTGALCAGAAMAAFGRPLTASWRPQRRPRALLRQAARGHSALLCACFGRTQGPWRSATTPGFGPRVVAPRPRRASRRTAVRPGP